MRSIQDYSVRSGKQDDLTTVKLFFLRCPRSTRDFDRAGPRF